MLISLIGFVPVQAAFGRCTLSLAVSNTFPPYHMKDSEGIWRGISVDIARELTQKIDCHLEVLNIPWTRAIQLLKDGEIDLLTNFTFNKKRNEFALFLGPHHIERVAFVTSKYVSPKVTSIDKLSLFDGSIGIARENAFGEEFNKNVIEHSIVNQKVLDINNNSSLCYQMLINQHIDSMFDDEHSARYLLSVNQSKNNQYHVRFTFGNNPVYIGVSRKSVNRHQREQLNTSWEQLLKSNTLDTIYDRYGLTYDRKLVNVNPKRL